MATANNIFYQACAGLLLLAISTLANANEHNKPTTTPIDFLPGIAGDYFKIESIAVGRPYHIFVRLPQGYNNETTTRYPVVYILDGDSLFPILASNHLFLNYDLNLPEAIVVGIAYGSFEPQINKRGYDFSAPAKDAKETQGGAPQFLQFLKDELLPLVDAKFRTTPNRRILFGQSRGGYMVLYTAFTDPDLFWGYIASNPSFKPGMSMFFNPPQKPSRGDLSLAITYGANEGSRVKSAVQDWNRHWSTQPQPPWRINVIKIEGGTHAAFSPTSYRLGMSWLFDI